MFARDYARFYDLFNSDKPYQKEITFVYEWARKPQWVFDIGCGNGSYWKYYPKDTHILGIDKSRAMASGSKNIICADITRWKQNGTPSLFECATALFDVLNYIPRHDWWGKIPVEKGGYFIFDIWDKEKVELEGFRKTLKVMGKAFRKITPVKYDGKSVDLKIDIWDDKVNFQELHTMYLHSEEDIERFCGQEFEVVETMPTKNWQKWFKCRRK